MEKIMPNEPFGYITLIEFVTYNPDTGIFYDKEGNVYKYCIHNGYIHMSIGGQGVKAHRLAVLYMTKEWPKNYVDHIDGDRLNNKWNNLRVCCQVVNANNSHRVKVPKKSGIRGLLWNKAGQKWYVKHQYKILYYGTDFEEAKRIAEKIDWGYVPEWRKS